MKHTLTSISKINSFKIVLIYATVSAVYIYTSDYFLAFMIQDIHVMSNFQTYKGLGFIFITSLMLYALVKQNTVKLYNSFKQLESVSNTFNKKIKQSQEEYMALFNHSPMPMWIFEISTLKFLKVNEAAISSYGYTNDEFLNMTIKDIRPEEDIPLFLEMMAASLQFDRYDLPYLIKHRKKNGELIQVKVKTTSVEFEGHQARLTSATDITTEIESQNKLREIN